MRIAQVAPLAERVPPKKYGGTERVVHALTEELVRRGHEVTLFASGDSKTSAKLVSVVPRNLRESRFQDVYGSNIWMHMNVGEAYSRQDEFDVIHDHTGYFGLPTANMARTPVVSTYHGPFTHEVSKIFRQLYHPGVVTISNSQARQAPGINHIATVYNGLPMEDYPFSDTHKGYLLFVGRISMEKGVHHAISAAQYLDLPLIIAAKLDKQDMAYFQEYIEPRLSDSVRWIGEVDQKARNELYSGAMAMLHAVTWDEPFGLTMIEAMACGCPVVAFDRGSIPEVVRNGETGFVVHEVEEMLDAISRIDTIQRSACREHALTNFSAKRMADDYERIYLQVLEAADRNSKRRASKQRKTAMADRNRGFKGA